MHTVTIRAVRLGRDLGHGKARENRQGGDKLHDDELISKMREDEMQGGQV